MKPTKIINCLLAVILIFCSAAAQAPEKPLVSKSRDAVLNAPELAKLFDPIFADRMQRLNIPGAVVAVVKDGKIVFTKGYGLSDVDKKTPVAPDKTLFRIGSITKVFTATAVLQPADNGKISLSDDVDKYLKGVSVPNTFAPPVTFANLLTHTSGFDEISPGRRTRRRRFLTSRQR